MSRILLVNVADEEVDVLTRLAALDAPCETLVYHEDPEALVVRLARLARLNVADAMPAPRPDDVVVSGTSDAAWAGPWREAGARFLHPEAIRGRRLPLVEPVSPAIPPPPVAPAGLRAMEPVPGLRPSRGEPAASAPEPPAVRLAPLPEGARRPAPADPPGTPVSAPAAEAPVPATGPAAGPPRTEGPEEDVFADPAATFRYLARRALGSSGACALLWDGGIDVWIELARLGGAGPATGSAAEGLAVTTRWGEFRVSGPGAADAPWNRAALLRVAEDLALRDLMTWRDREAALRASPAVAGAGQAAPRLLLSLEYLAAEAALVWRRVEAGWTLHEARGDGLAFEGALTLSPARHESLFGAIEGWQRWTPDPSLLVQFQFAAADAAASLRFARVRGVWEAGA